MSCVCSPLSTNYQPLSIVNSCVVPITPYSQFCYLMFFTLDAKLTCNEMYNSKQTHLGDTEIHQSCQHSQFSSLNPLSRPPRSFFFFTIVCFERVSSKLHKNTVPVFEFIILQKHLHKAQVFVVLFFPVLFSEIHSQLCHICPPSPSCLSHQCES